jgi:hypothetical protein
MSLRFLLFKEDIIIALSLTCSCYCGYCCFFLDFLRKMKYFLYHHLDIFGFCCLIGRFDKLIG